jgi:hypothetical protein
MIPGETGKTSSSLAKNKICTLQGLLVNAQLGWLDNGFLASRRRIFLCFLLVSGVRPFLQAPVLASHWLEDFAYGTGKPTAGKTYS